MSTLLPAYTPIRCVETLFQRCPNKTRHACYNLLSEINREKRRFACAKTSNRSDPPLAAHASTSWLFCWLSRCTALGKCCHPSTVHVVDLNKKQGVCDGRMVCVIASRMMSEYVKTRHVPFSGRPIEMTSTHYSTCTNCAVLTGTWYSWRNFHACMLAGFRRPKVYALSTLNHVAWSNIFRFRSFQVSTRLKGALSYFGPRHGVQRYGLHLH